MNTRAGLVKMSSAIYLLRKAVHPLVIPSAPRFDRFHLRTSATPKNSINDLNECVWGLLAMALQPPKDFL